MVTSSDILFWTKYEVSEEDATRYTAAAEQHLSMDGGGELSGEIRTEALCYFIASRISDSKGDSDIISESAGGYSYSKSASKSSSCWLDRYRELLPKITPGSKGPRCDGSAKRVDRHVVCLNGKIL